jgi:hypothetical protein
MLIKITALLVAGALLSFVEPIAVGAEIAALSEDPIVLTIDGEPVSAREYSLVMRRQVAQVYDYFKQKYDLDDHSGYWRTSGLAETPLAKVREMTLEELTRIKVQQGLAKARGLIKDSAFSGFESDLKRENARRSKAIAGKEVIYGPKQYPDAVYYSIRMGEISYALQKAVCKERGHIISDQAVEAYYQENKESMGDKPLDEIRERIRDHLEKLDFASLMKEAFASAKVEVQEAEVARLVPRVDP